MIPDIMHLMNLLIVEFETFSDCWCATRKKVLETLNYKIGVCLKNSDVMDEMFTFFLFKIKSKDVYNVPLLHFPLF